MRIDFSVCILSLVYNPQRKYFLENNWFVFPPGSFPSQAIHFRETGWLCVMSCPVLSCPGAKKIGKMIRSADIILAFFGGYLKKNKLIMTHPPSHPIPQPSPSQTKTDSLISKIWLGAKWFQKNQWMPLKNIWKCVRRRWPHTPILCWKKMRQNGKNGKILNQIKYHWIAFLCGRLYCGFHVPNHLLSNFLVFISLRNKRFGGAIWGEIILLNILSFNAGEKNKTVKKNTWGL